jgi:hypothetical protein
VKLTQKIMRFLAPACEKNRQEFRHELARMNAHADDLLKTIKLSPEQAKALQQQK